jgi:hypothetical protein
MIVRLLTLVTRVCLGILVILNGPTNALSLAVVQSPLCSCAAQDAEIQQSKQHAPKKCCSRCSKKTPAKENGLTLKEDANKIRPTCPICPTCPQFPHGCCVSCPCKSPCAPPLGFVMPESPEIVWRSTDEDTSFSESHSDEPLLAPCHSQFVAFII